MGRDMNAPLCQCIAERMVETTSRQAGCVRFARCVETFGQQEIDQRQVSAPEGPREDSLGRRRKRRQKSFGDLGVGTARANDEPWEGLGRGFRQMMVEGLVETELSELHDERCLLGVLHLEHGHWDLGGFGPAAIEQELGAARPLQRRLQSAMDSAASKREVAANGVVHH